MALFEQIGKRLADAGQTVAQQTKDLAEITKLNAAISDKEKRIAQLFRLIGEAYYRRCKDDPTAPEAEHFTEIAVLYDELFADREKIKEIKGVVKCTNCGTDIPLHAAFCNACGTRVLREEAPTETTVRDRLCPNCQSVVEAGNLFCNYCGTKINGTNE